MLLKDKVAIIYGAGGAIGSATARAFARKGARVFLSGRSIEKVETVVSAIRKADGDAEAAEVDAQDEDAVLGYTDSVVRSAGRIDVCFNAASFDFRQGVALDDLSCEDLIQPIAAWTKLQFLTARAAARTMVKQRSGTILTLSASPARLAIPMTGGFGVACAAIEALTRVLAAELGPHGIRAVCLRPHRISETIGPDPDIPMDRTAFIDFLEGMSLLKRLPTLDDVANTAVFLGSNYAASMTGTVANLTGGASVD